MRFIARDEPETFECVNYARVTCEPSPAFRQATNQKHLAKLEIRSTLMIMLFYELTLSPSLSPFSIRDTRMNAEMSFVVEHFSYSSAIYLCAKCEFEVFYLSECIDPSTRFSPSLSVHTHAVMKFMNLLTLHLQHNNT